MFNYSLDKKREITDSRGNRIKDLTQSIFSRTSGRIQDYQIVRMSDVYHMRPDLVSQMMYDTDEYAEFVLKFAGISNPFTLDDDDVLLIPNDMQAIGMMADNESGTEDATGGVSSGTMAQIRNFFKFVNTEYQPDRTSYDRLKKTNIPSGVIAPTENNQTPVYIGDDGKTAVTIRGGRVYFGEDSGMPIAS